MTEMLVRLFLPPLTCEGINAPTELSGTPATSKYMFTSYKSMTASTDLCFSENLHSFTQTQAVFIFKVSVSVQLEGCF